MPEEGNVSSGDKHRDSLSRCTAPRYSPGPALLLGAGAGGLHLPRQKGYEKTSAKPKAVPASVEGNSATSQLPTRGKDAVGVPPAPPLLRGKKKRRGLFAFHK